MEDDGSNIFTEYRESGGPEAFAESLARSIANGTLSYVGASVTIYREDGETSHEWLVLISEDDELCVDDDEEEGREKKKERDWE